MKSFYVILILFLSINFLTLGSHDFNKTDNKHSKQKQPRPPFPIGHIPNFSKNNSATLSVFSSSLESSSQAQKNTPEKKSVVISCAPLPICYENKTVNQSKSCLKKYIPLISQEQQELRDVIFHKRKTFGNLSFIDKKSVSCSDCNSGYNNLQCAFLCNHYLKK